MDKNSKEKIPDTKGKTLYGFFSNSRIYRLVHGKKNWSTLPEQLPPFAASYILGLNKNGYGIIGEIIFLISKGYITPVKVGDTYFYYFSKISCDNDSKLWNYEKNLFNVLYYDIAQERLEISLDEFEQLAVENYKNNRILYKIKKRVSIASYFELVKRGYMLKYEVLESDLKETERQNSWLKRIKATSAIAFPWFLALSIITNVYWIIVMYFVVMGLLIFLLKQGTDNLSVKGKKSYKEWSEYKAYLQSADCKYTKLSDDSIGYIVAFNLSDKYLMGQEYKGINELIQSLKKVFVNVKRVNSTRN